MSNGGKESREKEEISCWWMSTDKVDFDSIAYSNDTVDDKKVGLIAE